MATTAAMLRLLWRCNEEVQEVVHFHLRVPEKQRERERKNTFPPCIFMALCGAAGDSHPPSSACEDTSEPLSTY